VASASKAFVRVFGTPALGIAGFFAIVAVVALTIIER